MPTKTPTNAPTETLSVKRFLDAQYIERGDGPLTQKFGDIMSYTETRGRYRYALTITFYYDIDYDIEIESVHPANVDSCSPDVFDGSALRFWLPDGTYCDDAQKSLISALRETTELDALLTSYDNDEKDGFCSDCSIRMRNWIEENAADYADEDDDAEDADDE